MTKTTATSHATAEAVTSCTTTREGGRFLITVSGDLDVAAVGRSDFVAALSGYRSDEPLDVTLDLGDVTFLDSTGLSWLMSLRSAAALANRKLRVRRSTTVVDKVLDMTQVRRYFPTESGATRLPVDPADAVAELDARTVADD